MVSSVYLLFFGGFVGAWATEMRKCANAQHKLLFPPNWLELKSLTSLIEIAHGRRTII
jgi:hypothetical protein